MRKNWWKILAVILVLYTLIAGFLFPVPRLFILHETIRNLYFHVGMWFAMMTIFLISLVYSLIYLNTNNSKFDVIASESINVGILFGFLGLATGSLWAKFTWGAWWTNDVQLNGAAITILTYLAYIILRNTIEERDKKARIAAVYNIFAFVMMIVFIGIWPRMNDSLHPGKGGNPGFSSYDLDDYMRMVFYPAVIGWILMGVWFLNIRTRLNKINQKLIEIEDQ